MIRSMTGYSKAQAEEGGYSVSVSIRGTNHRFLDVQVRFPSALESMDPLLRRLIKNHIQRGHVEVTVGFEQPGNAGLLLDRKLLAAYIAAYRTLQEEFGSASEPDLVALLRIPGLATSGNGEISPQDPRAGPGPPGTCDHAGPREPERDARPRRGRFGARSQGPLGPS